MNNATPTGQLRFKHNGDPCELTIDIFEEYDPVTEEPGDYQARIWKDGDTIALQYFPSEEACACWFMKETGATKLEYI